jgi:hypothetical protein
MAVFRVWQAMFRSLDSQGAIHAQESRGGTRGDDFMSNEYISYWVKVLFMAAVITTVLLLVNAAHCTTTKPQTNSLGVVQYNDNPLMYEAVQSLAEVTEVDGSMNLRVKPIGTYMLYDDNLLLCGLPTDAFQGIREPFLITYERVAHLSVRGVGCHRLVRVDNIESNERVK